MSGGNWTEADVVSTRTRPGAFFNLIGEAIDALTAGAQGAVAVIGRADWGPVGEVQIVTSEGQLARAYGGQSLVKLARQVLRGGASVVRALRVAGASASEASVSLTDNTGTAAVASQGTLTVDTNPTAGDTFTIDAKTYEFVADVTGAGDVDGNILLGADLAATQQNIIDAINLTGTPGTQYAASTTEHPTVFVASSWSGDDLVITAKTAGVAGDSIATTETFTAVTNVFDGATLGTTTAGADAVPGAVALVLTTLYPGERGNGFTASVVANPSGGRDLVIRENGVEIERHNAATNDSLAAVVESDSTLISASVDGADGRVLELGSDLAFTGGDSGLVVTAGDYITAQSVLESELFEAVVQDSDTTEANVDALIAWAADRREGGHRFLVVAGAAADTTVSAAAARAVAINSESVVFVYPGFTDENGVVFFGQEAAARVAGIIAGRGFTKSVTFAELDDADQVEVSLTTGQVGQLLEAGVLLLTHDGRSVRVERGINTFSVFTEDRGRAFSKIRTIATLDRLTDSLTRGLRAFIGDVTNDLEGQKSLLGAVEGFLDQFIQARAIKPGAVVQLDPANPPTSDQIFLRIGVTPLDSVEQIFSTIFVASN